MSRCTAADFNGSDFIKTSCTDEVLPVHLLHQQHQVATEFWVNDRKFRQKEVDAALGAACIRFTDDSLFEVAFPDGHHENWDPVQGL